MKKNTHLIKFGFINDHRQYYSIAVYELRKLKLEDGSDRNAVLDS